MLMAKRLLDIYSIVGLLISILAVALNYLSPKEIPLPYILIVLGISAGLVAFIMQISFILSKFSEVKSNFNNLIEKVQGLDSDVSLLKQTFKTEEALNKLKLDIKELQTRVFK